jgi:hypothetical protein
MPGFAHRPPAILRLVALLAIGSLAHAMPAAAAVAPRSAHAAFATPSSIAAVGRWIVVADKGSSTLSVLSASTGALEATVSHHTLGVSAPNAAVASTSSGRWLVFVAGVGGGVAELTVATTTAQRPAVTRLRILRPTGCARSATASLAVDAHGHVLEACSTGVVTEWAVHTGGLIRSFPAAKTTVTNATGLAVLATSVFVTNTATAAAGSAPDSVTELSLATGQRVRTVTNATNPAYAFSAPAGVASDGTHLWEINAVGSTVDELAVSNMAFVATSATNLSDPGVVLATRAAVFVSSGGSYGMVTQFTGSAGTLSSPWMMCNTNGPYQFDAPSGFAISGSSLWVTNSANGLIDRMNATTGALVKTFG